MHFMISLLSVSEIPIKCQWHVASRNASTPITVYDDHVYCSDLSLGLVAALPALPPRLPRLPLVPGARLGVNVGVILT